MPRTTDQPDRVRGGLSFPAREDVYFAAGVAFVFAGLWMVARPLALITLGLLLIYLAFRA